MLFSDLQNILNGRIAQQASDLEITQLATDSRNISRGQVSTLFFAIKGQNHDGHLHIPALYHLGIRQFVIESAIDFDPDSYRESDLADANIILVGNSIKALQTISQRHRQLFRYPVIAITGSNGKTIVKEWLYHLISPYRNTMKSPKSYNSQIGVPLSVWQMNKHHKLGIFEAGISTTDEMTNLQKVIQPTIGIFTNVGSAHDEGFADKSESIAEKLILFKSCDQLIYCKDHEAIHQQVKNSGVPSLSWSCTSEADITVHLQKQVGQSSLLITYQNTSFDCTLPFVDKASIENIMHCISAMLYLGHTANEILAELESLPIVKMRLELKPGINRCQIINDTYNNDLAGLEVALNFLSQQSSLERTLILSDILQSGLADEHLYLKVAQLLSSYKIVRFIGVGKKLGHYKALFPAGSHFFQSTHELISVLDNLDFSKEVILVKGAHPFLFEQVTARLTQKIHETVLEIDLNALTHNLNYYRQQLSPNTLMMVMVKAMAYGSGGNEIAHLLAYHKVDYLGVAYVDEGVNLRKGGIDTPIMVMNTSPDGFDSILSYGLEPEIYSMSLLAQLIEFLDGKAINIHLKIDSGMRRLGFHKNEINELVNLLKANPNINIKSIFSHLVGSDEAIHNEFSEQQVDTLNRIYNQVSKGLNTSPMKHILNSSGILRFPEYHFDMVRLGIGLYGIDSNLQYQDQLLPISTLKTTISQINEVKKGETIGYGRKGRANEDLIIATIAIGYADGFSRAFGNGVGEVIINGKIAPVIGNVCMDMTMVNITGIDTMVGDEVVIFGDQMPITTLADRLATIPYEILTNVSERVKRVYFQD